MKESTTPEIELKKLEPKTGTSDRVIWAAWSDRITFKKLKEMN